MSKYISIDSIMKYPIRINHYDRENGNIHFIYGIESVLEYIDNITEEDCVDIVRCKDCKYFSVEGGGYCSNSDGMNSYVKSEDFCSNAEDKDNEKDTNR